MMVPWGLLSLAMPVAYFHTQDLILQDPVHRAVRPTAISPQSNHIMEQKWKPETAEWLIRKLLGALAGHVVAAHPVQQRSSTPLRAHPVSCHQKQHTLSSCKDHIRQLVITAPKSLDPSWARDCTCSYVPDSVF